MLQRTLIAGGALCGALLLSATASAAPGSATGNVNMRTGPGTQYGVITTIPAGAPVEVLDCAGWCRVVYAGREGYASANYIATGYAEAAPPRYYQPAPAPRYYPPAVSYYRVAPPPRAYWRHGRPFWDDRYSHWRAGDWYWYDRDWHRRPRSGFSVEFGF